MAHQFFPKEVIGVIEALGVSYARLVGGAVRAFVKGGECPADVDVATLWLPHEVTEKLEEKKLKVIPTGLKHGTVTVIAGAYQVEVTTLREDMETDGRRAEVTFTKDWQKDSQRRDFTMNAMYLDLNGELYDWHNGEQDLAAGQVRFVGNVQDRVQEDYLRIFRYFRFSAHIGLPVDFQEVVAEMKPGLAGMKQLSAERITHELFKLLEGQYAVDVLAFIKDHHVLDVLGLVPQRLEDLEIARHTWPSLEELGCWYIVFGSYTDNPYIALSNRQKKDLILMNKAESLVEELGLFPLAAATSKRAAMVARAMTAKRSAVMFLQHAEIPEFPLKGQDVLDIGIPAGERVGQLLGKVEEWWLQQNLPDLDACKNHLVKLAKF
ncbi:MAG: hypothetical protein OXR68_04775 [Alphaproteobacteria bacterium]|nr:hypothetical protein [Alphaproteobacteria bacterium]MDD9919923.1 hypothetical protein [Alphaproteobacteria bacterium]